MRSAGEHLAEAERLIAEAWERSVWSGRRRATIDAEIVRRALDVPFLGDLIRAAWRLGPDADLSPPDFDGDCEVGFADILTAIASWGPC